VGALQGLVDTIALETDVASVAIFDTDGKMLAHAGQSGYQNLRDVQEGSYIEARHKSDIDVVVGVINTTVVPLDDLFSTQTNSNQVENRPLGYALLETSRETLNSRQREAMGLAIAMALGGALAGGLLASRLGRRVTQPIGSLANQIERIGNGDFSSDSIELDNPMRDLHLALNMMAQRLAWTQEELEDRIASATAELNKKKEEAESATLAKSRFLAAASHDLRQPTHALGMFVARLGQFSLEPSVRDLVVNLESAVLAMQDLLDSLLDVARLESGTVPVQMRDVPLAPMLQNVQQAMQEMASEKGLRFRVRINDLWVHTDPNLLHRIVMNLAHNAVRYTNSGSVLITARPAGNGKSVRIDVSDSGIGIAAEHQKSIFTEFYQVANSARERGHGLGLGLNIVERTVRLLGHRITLRSAPGCGTRFSVTLFRARKGTLPPEAKAVSDAEMGSARTLDGLRVLLIENDPFSRDAVVSVLQSWGCEVYSAISLVEARQLVAEVGFPEFLVSDYRLGPGGTGIQAIVDIRAMAGRVIPACLISGDTDPKLIRLARDNGLVMLHKPVRPAKLRSVLRRLNDQGEGGTNG